MGKGRSRTITAKERERSNPATIPFYLPYPSPTSSPVLLCRDALELLADDPVALVDDTEDRGCEESPETPKASVFRTQGASALREEPPAAPLPPVDLDVGAAAPPVPLAPPLAPEIGGGAEGLLRFGFAPPPLPPPSPPRVRSNFSAGKMKP